MGPETVISIDGDTATVFTSNERLIGKLMYGYGAVPDKIQLLLKQKDSCTFRILSRYINIRNPKRLLERGEELEQDQHKEQTCGNAIEETDLEINIL